MVECFRADPAEGVGQCRPFTWTKDPDTVIAKATDPRRRKASTASVTQH